MLLNIKVVNNSREMFDISVQIWNAIFLNPT